MSKPEKSGWLAFFKRPAAPKAAPTKTTKPKTATTAQVVIPAPAATTTTITTAKPAAPATTAPAAQKPLTPTEIAAIIATIKNTENQSMTASAQLRLSPSADPGTINLKNGDRVPSSTLLPAGAKHAPSPFAATSTWPSKFAAALIGAGFTLNLASAVPCLVRNGKPYSVDSVLYGLKSFLASCKYAPSAEIFREMASTIVVDVLSLMPTTSPLLP